MIRLCSRQLAGNSEEIRLLVAHALLLKRVAHLVDPRRTLISALTVDAYLLNTSSIGRRNPSAKRLVWLAIPTTAMSSPNI